MLVVVCILAITMGSAVADPLSLTGLSTAGAIMFTLALPVLMRHHHCLLICGWNFHMVFFFLKTDPAVREVLVLWSAGVLCLGYALDKKQKLQIYKPLLYPAALLFVGLLIAIYANHGIGAIMNEGWYGGKRYLLVANAVLGTFVLGAVSIPPRLRGRMAAFFFLAGCSYAIGDLMYLLGAPGAVQMLLPSMISFYEMMAMGELSRFAGIGWAAMSVVFFLQLRFGIRGLMDFTKPWRGVAYVFFLGLSMLGGHRIAVLIPVLVFLIQLVAEGLLFTRYSAYVASISVLVLVSLIVVSDKLPLSIQRALSFLPGQKSVLVLKDAQGTFDWRWEMWMTVLPQVPEHFWTGRGFLYSPTEQNIAQIGAMSSVFSSYEAALVEGTFHQGILTLLIPLGITTLVGFFWFVSLGLRITWRNYRFGDEAIKHINLFIFSILASRVLIYLLFYGQFETDMQVFAGLIGLSMALNGGVAMPKRFRPVDQGVATKVEALV